MKNRLLIAVIAIITALFVLVSCGNKEGAEETTAEITTAADAAADTTAADNEEETTAAATEETTAAQQENGMYDAEIAMLKGLFDGSTELFSDGTSGISDIISGRGAEEAADAVGYAVTDISGDGKAELVVSIIEEDGKGSMLLNVYTKDGDKTVKVIDGTARSAYYLLDDGILYQGSDSAATSIFAEYMLASDGKSLMCKDYWFTQADGENSDALVFYHNTKGDLDVSASEKLDVTEEEFYVNLDNLKAAKQQIALTAFSK